MYLTVLLVQHGDSGSSTEHTGTTRSGCWARVLRRELSRSYPVRSLFAPARCDPKPGSEQENAGDEVHPGRLAEEHGAEHEGGDGAKREEDGDTRGRGVAERPEPKDVADPAARPDEDNRQPAAGREGGRSLKEALSDAGRDGERGHGGEHGNGPHREGGVALEVGAVEHAAHRPAEGCREDGTFSD